MEVVVANVVRRFVQAGRADPPRWMTRAVEEGSLDPEAADVWPLVVDQLGPHFEESAAAAYWRNEASRLGFDVPGGLGPRSSGRWAVKMGDDLAEWRKVLRQSERLVSEQAALVADWPDAEVAGDLQEFQRLLKDHESHTIPTIGFERNFQFAVLLVDKAIDKRNPSSLRQAVRGLKQALQG